MAYYLDFEKPLEELESKIEELKRLSDGQELDISSELRKLEKKTKEMKAEAFFLPEQKFLQFWRRKRQKEDVLSLTIHHNFAWTRMFL